MSESPSLRDDRWFKRWRVIRSILILALMLGMVPNFYLAELARGRAAWNAYERDARQRGQKLDIAEFLNPSIPDAENFASVPIVAADLRASATLVSFRSPLSFTTDETLTKKQPPLANLAKQKRLDLEGWRQFLLEANLLDSKTDNAAADVLSGVETFAEPLEQLRVASGRPHCRFPVHWEKGVVKEMTYPKMLGEAAQVFALRAGAHLALGDRPAAYADFRSGLRLFAVTREEPSMISAVFRIFIVKIMMNAVWAGLAEGQWGEDELRQMEQDLGAIDLMQDYLFAVDSERGCLNASLDSLLKPRGVFSSITTVGDVSGKTQPSGIRFYPTGWIYHSKVRLNRYVDELMARVDPVGEREFRDRSLVWAPDLIQSNAKKVYYLHFGVLASALKVLEDQYVRTMCDCHLARLAGALERHRLARGEYPAELADLVPQFLSSLPVEVVNGEPYRYRRTEGGRFHLYSVGLDLHDDGGQFDPQVKTSDHRDWVWGYPAP